MLDATKHDEKLMVPGRMGMICQVRAGHRWKYMGLQRGLGFCFVGRFFPSWDLMDFIETRRPFHTKINMIQSLFERQSGKDRYPYCEGTTIFSVH